MYPVSQKFLDALRQSHTVFSKVELLRAEEVLGEMDVLNGTVQDDSTAMIRRRASLNLAPTPDTLALLPADPPVDGGLWPLGNELRLVGGITFRDGTTEQVPMGVFRIAKPKVTLTADGMSVSVECYDRSRAVSRNRWTKPFAATTGMLYGEFIEALIRDRLPLQTEFDFIATTDVVPQGLTFLPNDDPWKVAVDMAASFGAELFFDGNAVCRLQDVPDPLYTPSSFSYVSGADATITGLSRDLDDEQAYNGVVCVSENTDLAAPIRAEAWDTDVNSPTYYDPAMPDASRYGAVPSFMASQFITTAAQALTAAKAELLRVSGVIERIDFAAINNPAQVSGDVVTVGDASIGINSLYVVETITTGIGEAFTMSGTTRRRRAS